MSLRIVKMGELGGNSLDVVVAGDSPGELTDMAARNWVKAEVIRAGFPVRGFDRVPTAYPVDKNGECDGDLLLARPRKGGPVVEYRAEYKLSAGA